MLGQWIYFFCTKTYPQRIQIKSTAPIIIITPEFSELKHFIITESHFYFNVFLALILQRLITKPDCLISFINNNCTFDYLQQRSAQKQLKQSYCTKFTKLEITRITSSTQIKLNFSETYSLRDGGLDKVAVSAQLGHQGDFALRRGGVLRSQTWKEHATLPQVFEFLNLNNLHMPLQR